MIRQVTPLGCQIVCLFVITEKKGKAGVKGLIQSLERETQHTGHEELAAELKQGLEHTRIHTFMCIKGINYCSHTNTYFANFPDVTAVELGISDVWMVEILNK